MAPAWLALAFRSRVQASYNTRRASRIEPSFAQLPGYRITTQIGTGAGSKIYTAIELATGNTRAVKHVVRYTAADQKFFKQTETEYKTSSKVEHPNLRRSLSIHRVRKHLRLKELLLVMEYVHGFNLEKARPNRLLTFLTLFQKVALGLDALHAAGYLHTDIKPTNIMIAKGGIVKIIDFGQACPIHHRKERIQGTPDYIAPEQVRRLTLDARTDVFNLGATMYWVLTSEKYPTEIRGTDARGGINVITSHKPIAPVDLNDKIPLSLSKLVMECCRANPAERPANMKQVIERLGVTRKLWNKYREDLRTQQSSAVAPSADAASVAAVDDDAEDLTFREDA
jgi:serine/threonine-protein kinase